MKKVLLFLALFTLGQAAVASSEYTKTKYPIVLAHGMFGFSKIGSFDYWYNIVTALKSSGATVHVAHMSALNSSELRGEQLLSQVEEVLAATGAEKVNLIGHSHGTHAIRYVAAIIPQKVASVTAVGGPVKGSPVADKISNLIERDKSNLLQRILSSFSNAVGGTLNQLAEQKLPQDSIAGLASLTSDGAAKFNAKFPQAVPKSACGEGEHIVDNIHYFSFSGTGPNQSGITNIFDPSSWGMLALVPLFKGEHTDGLVGRCSSHLGKVLRDDYNLDHLDQVNQLLGMSSMREVSPLSIYRQHANRLKNLGL